MIASLLTIKPYTGLICHHGVETFLALLRVKSFLELAITTRRRMQYFRSLLTFRMYTC